MKRKVVIVISLFIWMLAACEGNAQETTEAAFTEDQVFQIVSQTLTAAAPTVAAIETAIPVAKPTLDSTQVSVGLQLVVGSVKLEGTPNAITVEQAEVMYPLWVNLKTLMDQQNTGGRQPGGDKQSTPQQISTPQNQTEINTILEDIQKAMTTEQLMAIVDLKLTQEDVTSFMEVNNITMNVGGSFGGNGPGGGEGTGGGQPPSDMGSANMQPGQRGMSERIPGGLIDLLIQLLETRKTA